MKKTAAAVAAIAFVLSSPASAQSANPAHQPMPPGMHDRYEGQPSHGVSTHVQPIKEHWLPHGPRRHRVTAIVVYVPAIGWVNLPYYYAPSAPLYVDRDPPDYAYRDANGFYYWFEPWSGSKSILAYGHSARPA